MPNCIINYQDHEYTYEEFKDGLKNKTILLPNDILKKLKEAAKKESYINVHDFSSKPFTDSMSKLITDSGNITLHGTITLANGQIREHAYEQKFNNGTVQIMDGSVTGVLVEKDLRRYSNNLPTSWEAQMMAMSASVEGTIIHGYAENVIKNIVDPATGMLLSPDQFSNEGEPAKQKDLKIYRKVEKFIIDFLNTFPVGTRIFSEVRISNPNLTWYDHETKTKKKGIGGSIDLLVVTPDNFLHLYDYKSTSKLENGVKDWKYTAINSQLKNYKNILEKVYGFKHFGQLRAFPINVQYDSPIFIKKEGLKIKSYPMKDIEIGNGDYITNPNTKEYLDPICADTERTKEKELNTFIAKLNEIDNILRETKGKNVSDWVRLVAKRQQLRAAINDIKLLNGSDQLLRQVSKIIEFANELFYQSNKNLEDMSPNDRHFLYRQLSAFATMKDAFATEIEELRQISRNLTNPECENAKQSYLKIIEFTNDADKLIKAFDKKAIEEINIPIVRELNEDPDRQEKILNFMQQYFNNMSTIPMQTMKIFYKYWSQAISEVHDKGKEITEKAEKMFEDFKKFANVKDGKPFYEAIEEYFFEDGKATGIYSKEFYEKRDDALATEDWKTIKSLFDFDQKAYDERFAKFKEEETEFIDTEIEKINNDSTLSSIEKKKFIKNLKKQLINQIKRFKTKYDINNNSEEGANKQAWLNKNNYFLRAKAENKSKKFQRIENTPVLKEIYEAFEELNNYAISIGAKEYTTPMKIIGGIEASDKELLSRGLKTTGSPLDAITIDPKEVNKIVHTDTLTNLPKKSINSPIRSRPAENATRDIFQAYKQVAEALAMFKAKKDLEGHAQDLLTKERNRKVLVSNKYGVTSTSVEKEMPGIKNMTNYQVLEYFTNLLIYGENPKNWDLAITIPKIGTISVEKTVSLMINWFTLKTLGFSLPPVLSNTIGIGGNISQLIKEGLYFNNKQYFEGLEQLMTRDVKMMKLLHYFNMEIGLGRMGQDLHITGIPWFRQKVTIGTLQEALMHGMKTTDEVWHKTIQAATMHSRMFDEDGEIVTIRDFCLRNSKYNALYEEETSPEDRKKLSNELKEDIKEHSKYSLYNTAYIENGVTKFKNQFTGKDFDPSEKKEDLQSEKTKQEEYVKQLEKDVSGSKNLNDSKGYDKIWIAKLLFTFRNWIPNMLRRRFGKPFNNPSLKKLDEGYWSYFMGQFSKDRFLPLLKHLLEQFTAGRYSTSMLESAKANYEKFKDKATKDGHNFNLDGDPYGQTFEQFYEGHIARIAAALRDITLILATSIALGSFIALTSGDDTSEEKNRDQYVARILQKFYNEFSFYFDPREFQQLVGNSVPMMGLLIQLIHLVENSYEKVLADFEGDEKAMQKAHPGKFFVKLFPGGGTALDVISFMDDDFRKDWGLKQRPMGF